MNSTIRIERGLPQFDVPDHYAVLGLPITSDPARIRKRYLKIAKGLHPDSFGSSDAATKDFASQLFSKLVSPAYQVLTNERERTEYGAMMRLLAQRLQRDPSGLLVRSEAALELQRLAQRSSIIDNPYEEAVGTASSKLYDSLDTALELVANLSELNLVFLLSREGTPAVRSSNKQDLDQPPVPVKSERVNYASRHFERAKSYILKRQWQEAVQELRDALKIEPENSAFHAQLGFVYMQQSLAGMARISFQKALRINPNEPLALKHLPDVSGGTTSRSSAAGTSAKGKTTPRKGDSGKGGGLFGGLFGKK
ncbi:J domain-containing protein [Leptolyngbya sp. FACHB-261]|uniref:J domain-containing protein n=1 Tax=Leptolyngbya sp. FACHB-261 TaxID=2692806 RepID=UPI0028C395E9|nr:J domain-containing protein [Leptolyngbya sp. FACHB-261]